MPLQKGSGASVISSNIKELHSGNTYARTKQKFGKKDANRQSVAIAYSEANKAKGRAFGGVAPQMPSLSQVSNPGNMMSQAFNPSMQGISSTPLNAQASGLAVPAMMQPAMGINASQPGSMNPRPFNRGGVASSGINMTKGPIISAVPGRTDKHFTHVPSGSFVIPADIVSGHGQGNTLAGINTLQKFFKMGQHSTPIKTSSGFGARKFSKGGSDHHVGKPVPVKLAGGEIVVPPENAHETMERFKKKKLTLEEAHKALDEWVVDERKKLRKTLAGLPPPARD